MSHTSSSSASHAFDPAEPIAVVGMAMRFPGGSTDSKRFWDMLEHGRSAHGPIPKSRFNIDGYYHPDGARTGAVNIKGSYFNEENPFYFDAPFFAMTQSEANGTDGQQRLMLEVAYETLENAGIPMHSVIGSKTGVYVGCFTKDFESVGGRDPFGGPFYAATGNGQSMLSNRVSWFFDLRGPSFTIDTACSSSLYAVHLACQSLRAGETTAALVGGTNLIYDISYMRDMVTMTFFSPDGICHSFDHRANGYARGDGIGGVMLKTVKQALADGDTIRAVIRGTGLNQDGKTPGITMPSPDAQAELIRSTYAAARLSLEKTAYFEAHGTGTAIGDPYELSALGATFGTVRTSEDPIYVGSVKTNIGHLEGCAGLAGLIKTVLVVEKGQIPPLAGFEKANPRLKLDEWHVALPEKLVDWPSDGVRRASVNSFGYGGANAHVIVDDAQHFLQEYGFQGCSQKTTYSSDSDESSGFSFAPTPAGDELDPFEEDTTGPEHKLFVFSTADQAGLQRIASTYSEFLEEEKTLLDSRSFMSNFAYTLASRRSLLDHRSFVVANSGDDLKQQLLDGLQKRRRTAKTNNVFMVFSGQGAQWPTMGKALVTYPVYRDSLHRAQSELLKLEAPWSLIEELFLDKEHSRIDSPDLSQPLCTALQLALVDLLRSWDVVPKSVVGHSSGEIAAAYAAGHITHEDAMKVAYLRGIYSAEVNQRQPDVHGAMMAAGLSPEACKPYLDKVRPGSVVIACINAPSSVTLSGDKDAIIELEAMLNEDGVFARRLRVGTAYHSHHMKLIAGDYLQSMGAITSPERPPSGITMFSSVTAAPLDVNDINAEYWVKNLLGTVRFSEAVRALVTQPLNAKSRRKVFVPYSAMIECGPAEALKGPLNQILAATDEKLVASVPYVSMLSRGQNAESTAMKAAGRLWAQGIKIDLTEVNFPGSAHVRRNALVNLPPYPWNHTKMYFHTSSWSKKYLHIEKPRTDLLGLRLDNQNPDEPRWHNWIKLAEQPWLSDHRVQQRILYPGAAMVTMAFEAARELVDSSRHLKAIQAERILFKRGLMIPTGDEVVETSIHLRPFKTQRDNVQSWEFTVFSRENDESWQENCSGLVSLIYITDQEQADADDLEWKANVDMLYAISKRATRSLSPETFYKLFDRKMNLQYGTLHQNVTKCIAGIGEGLGTVTIPDTQAIMPARFEYPHLIHPSTLDSVFHMQALGYLHSLSGDESLIPISIDSIYVSADVPTAPGVELLGYSKGTQSSSGDSIGDIVLSDEQWVTPKVVVRGFLSRDMSATMPQAIGPDTRSKKCINIEWVEFQPKSTIQDVTKDGNEQTENLADTVAASDVTEVVLLHSTYLSQDVHRLLDNLSGQLKQLEISSTSMAYSEITDEAIPIIAEKVIISVAEAEEPIIANWDAEGFATFKKLSLNAGALLWITRGGDAVTDQDLQFHLSTGILRTVRVERPQLKLAHLDIDPKTAITAGETASVILDVFKASILNDADAVEQEFAEVDGKIMVPRLQTQESFHAELGRRQQSQVTEQPLASLERPLKGLEAPDEKGIHWSDHPSFAAKLAIDEVDVKISSIALEPRKNSKNSMSPTDATGTVTAIGAGVSEVSVGDRVVVCGLYEYATHTRTHKDLVRAIPDFMGVNTAAALPSALCAAEAMVIGSSNVQPGEKILICALPGSLQQTLISFAKHIGAEIFVTCETQANRRLLEDCFNLPDDHVLGAAHSEATWKTLKCILGNDSVDVIIDTVGTTTEQSMTALADFGRFVTTDAAQIMQSVESLARNITLATVDIEHMRHVAPSRLAKIFAQGWNRARAGVVDHSMPGRRFQLSEIDKAADYLHGTKCSGGALVTFSPDALLSVLPPSAKQLQLDPQATYVLSGGLGGIGRSIAEMMFAAGARNITFLSRSGAASSEAKLLLESLQHRGCNAQAYACDITDKTAVVAFMEQSRERGEIIRGAVQCAMVLRDSMFENMTFEQWTQSLAPKVQGTWHLHELLPSDMDFFIMLSSMAGIIGNPGQANYSAAGTYQDALSRHRRANGMASTTIDLGIVSDVGYIAENAAEFERLAYLENLFISERDLHLILSAAMLGQTRDGCQVSSQLVTGVGKELLAGGSIGTAMASDLKYIHLQDSGADGADSGDASEDEEIKAGLKAAGTFVDASKIVEDVLATNLGRALTMEKEDIDLEKPIHAYGVDSLVAVEVRNMIFRKLKADISVFDIMSNMPLTQLAAKIVSKSKLVKAEIAAEGWQD